MEQERSLDEEIIRHNQKLGQNLKNLRVPCNKCFNIFSVVWILNFLTKNFFLILTRLTESLDKFCNGEHVCDEKEAVIH